MRRWALLFRIWLLVAPLILTTACHLLSSNTQSPALLPLARDFTSVSGTHAWLVAHNGRIFRTRDGAATWDDITQPTVAGAVAICFTDIAQGWLLRGKGELWHSSDGGQTWGRVEIVTGWRDEFPDKITFSDGLHGWAVVSSSSLWYSEDGGVNWQKALSANIDSYNISSEFWWAAISGGKVIQTNDSGQNWHSIDYNGSNIDTNDVDINFFDMKNGWIATYPFGHLYRTNDGGKTWSKRPDIEPLEYVKSAFFVSDSEGWAVGMDSSRGTLLHTINNGQTWSRFDLESNDIFFDRIYFVDKVNGWLLGNRNLFRTNNGGRTWQPVFNLETTSKH